MARTNWPIDWETKRFWQDSRLYYHPVDLDQPDNFSVHGETPPWVLERRGKQDQKFTIKGGIKEHG